MFWETIGGALEEGETPEECIYREVMEEISCKLLDLKLFKVYIVREDNRQHVLIVFTGRVEDEIQLNDEIEDTKWIPYADIDKYEFYSGNCKEKLLDYFESANK